MWVTLVLFAPSDRNPVKPFAYVGSEIFYS